MLGTVLGPGFSKTARSHPGHREAGRDGKNELAIAIFGRGVANDVRERAAESAEAAKPNIETDVRAAPLSLPQQEHRTLHPPALKVPMRCLAEGGLEGTNEMGFGYIRDLRKVGKIQRLRISAIHGVARPQHSAIDLLYGPAHDTMLSRARTCRSREPSIS